MFVNVVISPVGTGSASKNWAIRLRFLQNPPNFLRASALSEHISPVVVIPAESSSPESEHVVETEDLVDTDIPSLPVKSSAVLDLIRGSCPLINLLELWHTPYIKIHKRFIRFWVVVTVSFLSFEMMLRFSQFTLFPRLRILQLSESEKPFQKLCLVAFTPRKKKWLRFA